MSSNASKDLAILIFKIILVTCLCSLIVSLMLGDDPFKAVLGTFITMAFLIIGAAFIRLIELANASINKTDIGTDENIPVRKVNGLDLVLGKLHIGAIFECKDWIILKCRRYGKVSEIYGRKFNVDGNPCKFYSPVVISDDILEKCAITTIRRNRKYRISSNVEAEVISPYGARIYVRGNYVVYLINLHELQLLVRLIDDVEIEMTDTETQ